MARAAPGVVIIRIVPLDILVRRMACGARQSPARKAAAFHQAQRLKPDVFECAVIHGRFYAMAGAAKLDLSRGFQLAGIQRHTLSGSVPFGSGMTPFALNAGHQGREVAADAGGVAPEACPQVMRALFETQRGSRTERRTRILSDGDAILMKLRKVADAGFTDAGRGSDQRGLPLRAGAQNPFNDAVGAIEAAKGSDTDSVRQAFIRKQVALAGLVKRLFGGQVLNERTLEPRHHRVGHTRTVMSRGFCRMAGGAGLNGELGTGKQTGASAVSRSTRGPALRNPRHRLAS
jgi:hypothetical protein